MRYLTTQQAAQELGVSQRRIQAMIHDGRLVAQRLGPYWVITHEQLEKVRVRKKGRPPKKKKPS